MENPGQLVEPTREERWISQISHIVGLLDEHGEMQRGLQRNIRFVLKAEASPSEAKEPSSEQPAASDEDNSPLSLALEEVVKKIGNLSGELNKMLLRIDN